MEGIIRDVLENTEFEKQNEWKKVNFWHLWADRLPFLRMKTTN